MSEIYDVEYMSKNNMYHSRIVVELSTKSLEIARVEVLRKYPLGKHFSVVQNEETTSPFHNAFILFLDEHIVQATHKLVQTKATRYCALRG